MYKSHSISNYKVQVSQVHTLASFIEAKNTPEWNSRPVFGHFFVRTPYMLEMMCKDVHQCEF